MIKHQLIFLLFTLPLLGFQVPQNQMADVLLNALTDEQKVSTYSLAKSIEKHSYTSKIKLIFNDGSSSNYKVDYLISAFKTIAQDADKSDELAEHLKLSTRAQDTEKSDKSDKLDEHLRLSTRLKIKEIKGIKLFVFSTSGERIIKFESAGLKIGKRKIGPFEIPSNKILIVSPSITYY